MICPPRFDIFKLALVLLVVLSPLDRLSAEELDKPISLSLQNAAGWVIVESPNFRCRCQLAESDARRLAECCEVWKKRLQSTWIGAAAQSSDRSPKCEVVIHPTKADYNLAIGRTGDTAVGSTRISFDQGRIVFCRIDVRADADDWSNAALPHELTHVVLCERFGGHALPRWADEGIAMLSESSSKHRERLTNLRVIMSRRQTLQIDDLLKMDRVPGPGQRDAFYGQSVTLVSCLIQKSTPDRFADFIEEVQTKGVGDALKKHYQIEGIGGLQREWDQWTQKPESIDIVRLKLHEGLNPIIAFVNDR